MGADKIKLIKSTFFNEQSIKEKLSKFILSSQKLSMGEKCIEFEEKFSALQGRSHTVLFNSGSSANLALIQALLNLGRLQRNDKVAFSALTWATNVMPILQLGLWPVPLDIEINTLNVKSDAIINALKENKDIKAFFISNILGFCEDIEVIAEFCKRNEIIFLEDNCESFGTVYRGKKLGNFSLASTCSFFVGHQLSTIEGGVVCTDCRDLTNMLKLVRAHGWDRDLNKEDQRVMRSKFDVSSFYDLYTFFDLGYNLRPTEITGFLGIEQIKIADEIVEIRDENFRTFHAIAKDNCKLIALRVDHIETVSSLAYPVVCKDYDTFRLYRDRFVRHNIEIRPIVGGNITSQPFYKKYSSMSYDLPNADFVHRHGFYFPNNPELTLDEISRISALLKD
jgi:CDP-6-deoxy-D-xylo-4-hexulose-3-dehydrase